MSHLLYNWLTHSASTSLLIYLNSLTAPPTQNVLWLLIALLLVLAVIVLLLVSRLLRTRKELSHLLQQFDQLTPHNRSLPPSPSGRSKQRMGPASLALHHQGFFDPLTQLPNRRVIEAALTKQLRLYGTAQAQPSALLVLDLNNLDRVNDTYGRTIGDEFLQNVAQRLQRIIRPDDVLARLNKRKFAILVKSLPQSANGAHDFVRTYTTNIQKSLESPYLIDGIALQGQISIGVASLDSPHLSAQEIIQRALLALNQTHHYRGLRVECFNARLLNRIKRTQQLSADLPRAIEKNQMKIVLHPQHCFGGTLIGVELLLRWRHPTLGNISPAQFIPIAERENYIHTLGMWALEQARDFIQHNELPNLSVSINVSPLQFHSIYFPEFIELLVNQRSIMGDKLIIELTEGTIMENVQEAQHIMILLNQLGYRFVLDDFGTGYSNLSAISSFPLYGLKLDRSLVTGIAQDRRLYTIARMVASLAHSLNLHCLAEGVEQQKELDTLKKLGFDAVQGFYFSRPIPLEKWPVFLAQREHL